MALSQETIDGLKGAIGVVRGICQQIDDMGLVRNFDSDATMVDTYNSDLLSYMLYLTASDGGVHDEEAAAISSILDIEIDAAQCMELIQRSGVYSTGFESTVPTSFQLVTMVGKDIFNQDLGQALYNVYQALGQAIVVSDEALHPQEVEDLNIYLGTLQGFLDSRS